MSSASAAVAKNSTNAADVKKPCSFYLQGRCKFGSKCKFSHDVVEHHDRTQINNNNIALQDVNTKGAVFAGNFDGCVIDASVSNQTVINNHEAILKLYKERESTHCKWTCHPICIFANDEDKRRCAAMDITGHCTVCKHGCHWEKHFVLFRFEKTHGKESFSSCQYFSIHD